MLSRDFWSSWQASGIGLPMEGQNGSCSSTATGREVSNAAKRCYFMSVPQVATSRCFW